MAVLASVYILDVPYHADIPYTYFVPGTIVSPVTPGCLVEVPYGRGNRRMTGIVWETHQGEVTDKTKPVSARCDGEVLSEEMLRLCLFLKEYTLCTFGEAVRAALPGAALARITDYYRVCENSPQHAVEKLPLRAGQVYEYLRGHSKLTKQRIQGEFPFDCTEPLQTLIQAGLCEKVSQLRAAGKTPARQFWTATGNSPVFRSERQRAVWEKLSSTGDAWEAEALFAACELSPAVGRRTLAALAEKNLVSLRTEEDWRDPFRLTEPLEQTEPPVLNAEQNAALSTILSLYRTGKPQGILLHGVTGSGKTNVMLAAIEAVLADGRGVILMVPEIALTPQTVGIFRARFGERIAVLHSGLSAGERLDAWKRIRDGHADVVIGTRSAVFAPLPSIGMILMDEEHEYTYKSDTNPKYHARDVAARRCGEHGATLLLASATPSVTTYYKATTGAYTLVRLSHRYGAATLPQVEICDMRGVSGAQPLSDTLLARLTADKAAGRQAILFLNRRGYHHFISCRSCGRSVQCPRCSVSLTYHSTRPGKRVEDGETPETRLREDGVLVCHMCGYRTKVPQQCPVCGQSHFLFMGCGTQKAEEDVAAALSGLRVLRMDTDTTQSKFAHEALLDRFRHGEADVLLGTQMVTKGHDFPKVSTVGVLNADSSLFVEDYRASERTFSMLTQVIGRAGRADVPGYAVIQTRSPENEILRMAARQDYDAFYRGEIRLRRALCYPPFCDIAVLTLAGGDEGYLHTVVTRMGQRIREYIDGEFSDVALVLFGPFEAPVYRVQNVCRMRFVLKCKLNRRARAFLHRLLCEFSRGGGMAGGRASDHRVTVSVDLNPSTI